MSLMTSLKGEEFGHRGEEEDQGGGSRMKEDMMGGGPEGVEWRWMRGGSCCSEVVGH